MSPPGSLDLFGDPRHPDTICGVATPLGQGGIGIIRASGPDALIIADQVFHGKHRPTETASHRILHGKFVDPAGADEIDEVLLSVFRGPNSYTGEDIAEFNFHGSPTILSRALSVLTAQGLRLAGPGEFTFRAFCNGRLDLTQAEAVAELVGAKSEKSADAAYRQLNGSLKELIGQLRTDLIEALAWLEMSADFVEEDLEFKKIGEISGKFDSILGQIATLKQSYQRSRIIRDGLMVTIVGAPNVGKSSIFNRLLARERSIVTTVPGTTRDTIDEYVVLAGYPVRFIDTAGIRRTEDAVETIGIDRTIGHLEDSDLVFWVLDGSVGFTDADANIQEIISERPMVVLINKSDIAAAEKISHCHGAVKATERRSLIGWLIITWSYPPIGWNTRLSSISVTWLRLAALRSICTGHKKRWLAGSRMNSPLSMRGKRRISWARSPVKLRRMMCSIKYLPTFVLGSRFSQPKTRLGWLPIVVMGRTFGEYEIRHRSSGRRARRRRSGYRRPADGRLGGPGYDIVFCRRPDVL
jgi:tRNA modification GTPase